MNIVDKDQDIDNIDFLVGSVMLIDKEKDWTSFDAVNKLRWGIRDSYGIKKVKVGHAGTLDPMATGLLIICSGKMTKSINEFQGQRKKYSGTICLGATTASYDAETEIDERFDTEGITTEMVLSAAERFIGKIDQVPPIFSALKTNGVRNYVKARKGEHVEVKARPVEIYSFDITKVDLPDVEFVMECSKGTYVRSLAYDLGRALDNGGHLTKLRREAIGDFNVDRAINAVELADIIRSKQRVSSKKV